MFENLIKLFKKAKKEVAEPTSKSTAKERLHLVLMQDRANVSADFLELMKQEIIEVIKKYIEVEEEEIDVRLKNKVEEDGTTGAPFLYANIPVFNVKHEYKKEAQADAEKAKTTTKTVAPPKEEKQDKPDKKTETDNPEENVGVDDPVHPEKKQKVKVETENTEDKQEQD
ncbi:MAG: cell division topological specificity factor MinE [Oscillospiraceae bacterium]|nr:cell division topological specificity factor MinE [Oscillospiraceae bacterium]